MAQPPEENEARGRLSAIYHIAQGIPQTVFERLPFLSPDLAFVIDGRKVAFFSTLRLHAPEFVTEQVREHQELLNAEDLDVAIITSNIPENALTIPGYSDIKRTVEAKKLHLIKAQAGQLSTVFAPNHVTQLPTLTPEQRGVLTDRLVTNKHIPSALLGKTSRCTASIYADVLEDIATEYNATNIPTATEEYPLVQRLVNRVLQTAVVNDIKDELSLLQLTQEELMKLGSRDHFVHSFQVFLTGTLAINCFRDNFSQWSGEIGIDSLERSWLMASLFHDICFPLENRDWMGPYGGAVSVQMPHTKYFIDEMCDYLTETLHLDNAKNEALNAVLLKHSFSESSDCNHGVLSSLRLLSRAVSEQLDNNVWSKEVVPAAAAIALHDKKVWPELVKNRVFPFDMALMPIGGLLIFVDQLQAWGRPGLKGDPDGRKTLLADINVNPEAIELKTLFLDAPAAILSAIELGEIKRICVHCQPINFSLKPVL